MHVFLKNLVDEAAAGEARPSVDQHTLMVQRVGSEQLSFALQQAHRDWLQTLVLPKTIEALEAS